MANKDVLKKFIVLTGCKFSRLWATLEELGNVLKGLNRLQIQPSVGPIPLGQLVHGHVLTGCKFSRLWAEGGGLAVDAFVS